MSVVCRIFGGQVVHGNRAGVQRDYMEAAQGNTALGWLLRSGKLHGAAEESGTLVSRLPNWAEHVTSQAPGFDRLCSGSKAGCCVHYAACKPASKIITGDW
jgi:hypothetical protein